MANDFPIPDVVLGENDTVITGQTTKLISNDLELDSPKRRKGPGPNNMRRAIVHNQVDGLTINYDQDYPGGVTLRAVDMIEGNPYNAEHANGITMKTRVLNCKGTDFILDETGRRKKDKNGTPVGGQRRALVHDIDDKLTINYRGDYPGGVTIEALDTIEANPGNTEHANSITVKARVLNCKGTDIILDSNDRRQKDPRGAPAGGQRRALVHDQNDKLAINYGGDYPGGVNIRGTVELPEGQLILDGVQFSAKSEGRVVVINSDYCSIMGILNLAEGELKLKNATIKYSDTEKGLVVDRSLKFGSNAEEEFVTVDNGAITMGRKFTELGIKINSQDITVTYEKQTGPHNVEKAQLNLVSTIKSLQSTIAQLENRVKQLESKIEK